MAASDRAGLSLIGVTRAPALGKPWRGRRYIAGEVAALAVEKPLDTPAQRHAEVVTAAEAFGDILPAGRNAAFPDPQALIRWLQSYSDALAERLERVAGCVEFHVRAPIPETPAPSVIETPASAAGRRYLAVRRQDERARLQAEAFQAALEAVAAPVRSSFSEMRLSAVKTRAGEAYAEAALLAPANAEPLLRQAFTALAGAELTGPWPVYTFAALDPSP